MQTCKFQRFERGVTENIKLVKLSIKIGIIPKNLKS